MRNSPSSRGGPVLALAGGADWISAMAGSLHPPCRRKKLRPLRPRLTARTPLCSVPSSSPHKIFDFAGAPLFLPEEKEKTGRARSKRVKEICPRGGTKDEGRKTKDEGLPTKIGRPSFLTKRQVSGSGERRADLTSTSKPPLALRRGLETCVINSLYRTAPRKPRPPAFLFWTVHGPFSLFIRGMKRENGGCNAPAIAGRQSAPPARASTNPPARDRASTNPRLRTEANSAPPPRSGGTESDAPCRSPRWEAPSSTARTCRPRPY